MFSESVLNTIKSTAPLLAEHGLDITKLFYQKLFHNHPELKNIFNMAHQQNEEQQLALAEAVFNYAVHIEKLEALGPMVNRIANKHASLNVKPEHYPIVGKYLLEAIQDHLGLPADHEALAAWSVAYTALAQIFIAAEKDIYEAGANKVGGWMGFKPFKISNIVQETLDVRSFYLIPEDGQLVDFLPGQYIGMKLTGVADGYDAIRQYSLSNEPGKNYYRITVKAEAYDPVIPGLASNTLHGLRIGDRLMVQPPVGDFHLHESDRKKVFLAGGVGLTPLVSMMLTLVGEGKDDQVTFIHSSRSRERHIMHDMFKQLRQTTQISYRCSYDLEAGAAHQGLLNAEVLDRWIEDKNVDVYACGPAPFIRAMQQHCKTIGIPEEQFYFELFGPTSTPKEGMEAEQKAA